MREYLLLKHDKHLNRRSLLIYEVGIRGTVSLDKVFSWLYSFQCLLFSGQKSVFNIRCSVFNVKLSVFRVQCLMFSA